MITETDIRPTMTDRDVVRFVNMGYVILEGVIPDAVNREIYDFICSGQEGGQNMLANGLVEQVTLNRECLGVVRSLLGQEFEVPANYHVHPTSTSALCWHSDGISDRRCQLHSLQNYYFPQTVTADMGPTVILPGSHLRHVNRDALAHYGQIRGAHVLTVPAGTVVFTHYSLWHAREPHRGGADRYMIKYAYRRTTPPRRDWITDRDEVTGDRIFMSDRQPYTGEFEWYRERFIRARFFRWLCGLGDDPLDGSGPEKFHPTRPLRRERNGA
jgi:hypothetical protein